MHLLWPATRTLNEIMAIDGILQSPWLVIAPKADGFYWEFYRHEIAVACKARNVGRLDETPTESEYAVVFHLAPDGTLEDNLNLVRPGGYLVAHVLLSDNPLVVTDRRFALRFERLTDRRSDLCQSRGNDGLMFGWYVWRREQ